MRTSSQLYEKIEKIAWNAVELFARFVHWRPPSYTLGDFFKNFIFLKACGDKLSFLHGDSKQNFFEKLAKSDFLFWITVGKKHFHLHKMNNFTYIR